MCLDYRKVNKHLETDIYPLPRLEELIDAAAGNKYYVTLDLKDAYYQVELAENSRDVTTFSEGVALYRFTRLPFGIASSPPLKKKGYVHNYLNGVILYAPDFNTLVERIDQLFTVLAAAGVKLNLTKCKFGQQSVKYLGHIISEKGCRPDPKNIEAIMKMNPPKNLKDVRRYLGLTGFYRKFIPSYARLALPLTNLAKKNTEFV